MERIRVFQKGWNFSQDGPGNRLVYHFQGCNLHCPWCSNPEGISINGTLMVKEKMLVEAVCPKGAIRNTTLDRQLCNKCKTRECVSVNRNQGITLSCVEYASEDIVKEAEEAKGLFHSNGGVTFTGGEPTLQFEPLLEILKALKTHNINSAIETNGTHPLLPELFQYLDVIMIDLKHYDSQIHLGTLGAGNETVIANIRKASDACTNLIVRIPLVPGFNDSLEDMSFFIKIINTFNNKNLSVEFLAYHEYGKVKWRQCGMEYAVKNDKIEQETIKQYRNLFDKNGIKTILT